MSVHIVYKQNGAKMMRPVCTREEYLAGSKRMSTTVGMDIDHLKAEEMPVVRERILSKKDELALLMLEESARGAGYHLVFKRRADLDQVGNLKWASDLLEVAYDAQAKDITRVFFTTTEAELIYLDDEIFEIVAALTTVDPAGARHSSSELGSALAVAALQCCSSQEASPQPSDLKHQPSFDPEARYNGVLFKDIIAKYWELYNDGKEPMDGDRNVLTFELAVTIRSICGYSLEQLMQVVPNYWAKPDGTCTAEDLAEWRKTLENALKEPRKGMPYRLKQVLQSLKSQQAVKACGGTLTTPPAMPKKLPPLIRLLTKNVPWFYKPAVANAVFPGLGAHLHGVKFRYWDNVEHEATFMNGITWSTRLPS